MEGWICPRCRRVYGPFVKMCEYCKPEISTKDTIGVEDFIGRLSWLGAIDARAPRTQVPQSWGGESCPGCGGPRWAGPQSGCPQGWHYGTTCG